MKLPKVSIIIPVLHLKRPKNPRHFFTKRYTIKDVLADIALNVQLDIEVIVITNGSDIALETFVRNHKIIDKYCINSTNVGVSRSWNIGAQFAEGDALCFVNDDVFIGKGALELLYEYLCSDDKIGIVGPKGAIWNGARHVRYVGEKIIEPADAISGFLFMVKTDKFHKLGGFDTAYTPAGFEEIDLCYKAKSDGLECMVIPGLDIKHYHQHGVSAHNATIHYMSHVNSAQKIHKRNLSYFIKKWNIEE